MKTYLGTIALAGVALVSGCATFEPVPKEYTGPTASLRDTGFAEDATKAQLFAAMEIDGNRIANAFSASANASQGQGRRLTTVVPERKVKAVPMKVSLRCGHATGAPIDAIASQLAGTFFAVEGVVDFTPQADGKYVVKGKLEKDKSTCWVEDAGTSRPVTAIIGR